MKIIDFNPIFTCNHSGETFKLGDLCFTVCADEPDSNPIQLRLRRPMNSFAHFKDKKDAIKFNHKKLVL